MIDLSPAAKEARLTALATYIGTGSGTALLQLYTAPKPDPGAAITTQTLLVGIPLPAPFAASVVGDTLTIATIAPALATAGGRAAWGRVLNRNGDWALDAKAGLENDPDAWIWLLSGLDILAGSFVQIQTGEITE